MGSVEGCFERATRVDDSRLAPFARGVRDADLRAWGDAPCGLFLAESPAVIEAALDAGCRPRALLAEEGLLAGDPVAASSTSVRGASPTSASAQPILTQPTPRALAARIHAAYPETPLLSAPSQLFAQLAGYANPRSALVAFERPAEPDLAALLARARRIAVLEDVGNYANIGAAFRAAHAFGIDAVLVTPSCHDPLFRRAARASRGTVLRVPWARIGERREWAAAGIPRLHAAGFEVAAFALEDRSIPLGHPRLRTAPKLAIVLGTEGAGLLPSTLERCDHVVKIPMAHDVDSLNVAAASAVAFWELRTPSA